LTANLDSMFGEAIKRRSVPGLAAGVTTGASAIYQGAFGERTLGSGDPMSMHTVVAIASMTKPITAVAAMQLVERGLLDLDAPASIYAPYFADVQVLQGFDQLGQPRLRAPARPVTLRHLMTHTAGFVNEIWYEPMVRFRECRGIPSMGTSQLAALEVPLIFDPGERWFYSISIDWLGRIIENVTGQRFGAYLQEEILKPLGMTNTAFKLSDDMRSRLASVHQRRTDGGLDVIDFTIEQNPEFERGGGGLYSTVGDYLRFVRLMLNKGTLDGRQILKPETVANMSINQMGDLRVDRLRTAMPQLSLDAEFFEGMPKTWGLSFMINTELAPTGRSAGSLSWAGLTNCYFWIDPKKDIGGVFATQILPFVDHEALALNCAFETAVYESL